MENPDAILRSYHSSSLHSDKGSPFHLQLLPCRKEEDLEFIQSLNPVTLMKDGHFGTSSPFVRQAARRGCFLQLEVESIACNTRTYGDWLGKILAIMSLCPLTLVIALVTLIIFRRDLHTITFFLGTSLNEAINWILKHLIKELRPCRGRENLYSEYGMPSNHAQFMWFFSTYMAFFLLIRLHHGSSTYPLENAWKYLATVFFICIAAVVTYSRIYLHYHTWTQVLCGACLGVLFACIWFFITQYTFTSFFPLIAAWPISEFLMLRDTTLIPNVMWFEYTSHRSESRTRQRKLVSMKSQ